MFWVFSNCKKLYRNKKNKRTGKSSRKANGVLLGFEPLTMSTITARLIRSAVYRIRFMLLNNYNHYYDVNVCF